MADGVGLNSWYISAYNLTVGELTRGPLYGIVTHHLMMS